MPPRSRAPWLLTAKVTPPKPPEGYFRRPALLRQLDPAANRRVSVLRAPGGFGKTTTLAEMARRARKWGVLVAWLTVDEDDAPGLFGAHLAYAFEHAGLDPLRAGEDAWAATPLTHQIGMLVRAIETHAKTCLLVLDELELLPAESVDLLERLLRHGPRNLRFALSFRTNPGLDLASLVLEGSAAVVTTEQLRFTKSEVGRFVGGRLTRQELTETHDRTAGWPVALRIDRTIRMTGSAEGIELGKALTRNFLDSRLLRRLSDRDRALLLDLAVFDWVDTSLVDEVLESTNTRMRLEGFVALDGLLTPVDRDGAVRRLHPVVRQHCLRLLADRDPARMQHLHRRIAEALARRDQLIPAWRHAAATGDREFLGEMMERVGVFRMWLREGMTCLAAADRFLTPALLEDFPRLALIRCIARRLRLQFDEARALYRTTGPRLDDMARRRGEDYLPGMLVDRFFTEVSLVGGHVSDGARTAIEAHARESATVEAAPLVVCGLHVSRCVSDYQAARFETCRRHGLAALSQMAQGGFRHGEVFVNLHLGMAAMSRGRVQEAVDRYAIARRTTKTHFAADAALATSADALAIELDIERDRAKAIEQRTVTGLTELRGAWLDVHAAAVAVAAELTFARHGAEVGIDFLTDAIAKVRAMGLPTIVRYASALCSLFLVEAGRSDRAEQVWRDERLPTDVSDLIDLDRQSWREMEALSCARVRLLTELGDRDAARGLADRLRGVASEHGLTRTLMRALALSMTIDADTDRAVEPLVGFLRLTRDTDYLRPLVRHRAVSRGLLTRLLDSGPDPDVDAAARAALAHLEGPARSRAPVFSPREQAVLAELRKGLRNREIADLVHAAPETAARRLTLTRAAHEAVAANLDLAAEDRRVAAGRQSVRESRAALLPRMSASGVTERIDRDRAAASLGILPAWLAGGSVDVSQILYSDAARADVEIEEHRQRTRRQSRAEHRLDVVHAAAVGYLQVLRAIAVERIQRENLTVTRSNLDLAEVRRRIGVARASEVIRWENEVATNRRRVLDAGARRRVAEIALNRLLHRPLEEPFEAADVDAGELGPLGAATFETYAGNPFAFALLRDFLVREGLARAPELRRRDAAIAEQSRRVLAERRALRTPTVAARGNLTTLAQPALGAFDVGGLQVTLPPRSRLDWTVGVSASLPLFEGGARRAARARADRELEELRLRRRADAERIEQRIRSALHFAGASFAGIELAADAADAARRHLDLVTGAYEEGAVSILELLDAQQAAVVAEQAAANAVHDYLIDLMEVQRAFGRFGFFADPAEGASFAGRLHAFFAEAGYEPAAR